MSARVVVDVETRAVERIPCDLVVAGFFADDRPLRGGAGRIDWRLCGGLSELLQRERVHGGAGEAVLLPSPGSIAAPRVLLLGLGERRGFDLARAREAMRQAMARCADLAVQRVAVAPPGVASDDFVRHARVLVDGITDALASGSADMEILLSLPAPEADAGRLALEAALVGRSQGWLSLRSASREPAASTASPRGTSAQPI